MKQYWLECCVAALFLVVGCQSDEFTEEMDAGFDAGAELGALRVIVRDARDESGVQGATVRAGDLEQRTDGDGVARFDQVAQGQRIDVEAPGFVPATWLGGHFEELHIALSSVASEPAARVKVSGSLPALTTLPVADEGHRWRAVVLHTLPPDLRGLQPGLTLPERERAVCESPVGAAGESCSFELETRVGAQRLYALLLDVDTKGTPETSDDVQSVHGLALSELFDARGAAHSLSASFEALAMPDMVAVETSVASTSSGPQAAIVGVPGLIVKDGSGILLFTTEGNRTLLPTRELFEEAGYWLVSEATYAEQDERLRLRMLRRKLAPEDLVLSSWLAPPGAPQIDGTQLSFEAAPEAALHTLELRGEGGALLHEMVFVGDRHSVRLGDELAQNLQSATLTAIVADLAEQNVLDLAEVRTRHEAELERAVDL